MADILRAAGKVRPGFVRAAKIVLVETSPMLRSIQKKTLESYAPAWAPRLAEIADDKPVYLVANEFFDALPIRQFVLSEKGWHERMITTAGDNLVFALTPDPQPVGFEARGGAIGAVRETNQNAEAMTVEIGAKIAETNGAGLVIDYGYSTSGFGDTFQAVKENAYADPLESPGEADLTAHVDFAALKDAGAAGGAYVAGPVPQGDLLRRLGIGVRAGRLKSSTPEKSSEIDAAVERLTGEKEMGGLFKAMALSARGSAPLPGF
jgi:SAM-dependent MidA family methyltransferase